MQDKIDTIYVTYKDRFIRFGFEWFERLYNMHDTKIIMLNNKTTSLGQELVDNVSKYYPCIFMSFVWIKEIQNKIGKR